MRWHSKLLEMADFCADRNTFGLPEHVVNDFIARDRRLERAIDDGYAQHRHLRRAPATERFLHLSEADQVRQAQKGFLAFYHEQERNPFLPIAAHGPWIVTTCGAVVHDSGGYGMLGLGHSPEHVVRELSAPYPMANVMTASLQQARFIKALDNELGRRRPSSLRRPFASFTCLGSGSEALNLATRISDANAKLQLERRPAGVRPTFLAIVDGFHGRTDRPGRASHLSRQIYAEHLASYRNSDDLIAVELNDETALADAFAHAATRGYFIEAVILEPVMGEGSPGKAATPNFYRMARQLTSEHGSLLIVDSVQAGLRAHGCLSIVDYPGFEELEPPDLEAFAKAISGGQYPISVLAMTASAEKLYANGLYGNTMTGNPRGLAVVASVLESITDHVRQNIRHRGRELLDKLTSVQNDHPHLVVSVSGCGLLVAVTLNPELAKVHGVDGVGIEIKRRGINFVPGGRNGIRLTPHFAITSHEVDLIVNTIRDVFDHRSVEPAAYSRAVGGIRSA
ncbi:aminotransferase class III-fold pyridoxal phosphate-dependent enzyme [Nocardia sp. CNY236]|uniref:aminotransferase class III-fold pyridoxal phosphate-dependent enzyme n=1 Tax=Nocardia sp. CNY236 TaxID=1169152 RepID=UPI0009E03EE0|nr:aminotransferase class III-fold pyridoxal phosphate-dependent enzyme [Nocardia sp. CNY236]